jgi:hypothetical protein
MAWNSPAYARFTAAAPTAVGASWASSTPSSVDSATTAATSTAFRAAAESFNTDVIAFSSAVVVVTSKRGLARVRAADRDAGVSPAAPARVRPAARSERPGRRLVLYPEQGTRVRDEPNVTEFVGAIAPT